MIFKVTHMPLNEVKVELTYETKSKLKTLAWYGVGIASIGVIVHTNLKNKNDPEKD